MSGRLQPDRDDTIESLHSTRDEAVAQAIRVSQPGDQIEIHEASCASCKSSDVYDNRECDCSPTTITLGATA